MSTASEKTVAVVGAGREGRAMARLIAAAGYNVILRDLSLTPSERSRQEIAAALNADSVAEEQAERVLNRIRYADSVEEAARAAHIVLETSPDEIESKLEIFCLLDRICLPETVILSGIRTLAVSDISAVTTRSDLIVGFYLQDGNAVEIRRGTRTTERAVEVARELASAMGKQVSISEEAQSAAR